MSEDLATSDVEEDLSLDTLSRPENVGYLGTLAAGLLASTGSVTFVVDTNGKIILVNHTKVLIDCSVFTVPPGKTPVKTRPLVLDGRPQQVVLDDKGVWWEVEFQ